MPKENKSLKQKKIPLSLKLSLLQMAFFIAFTLKGFIDSFADSKYLVVVLILEVLFVASFVVALVITLSNKNKDELKDVINTRKRALKDVKLTLRVVNTLTQLISVALAFFIVLETYSSGSASFFKQFFAVGSAGMAVIGAGFAMFKTGRKVRKRVKKGKKAKEKKQAKAEKEAKRK